MTSTLSAEIKQSTDHSF